MDTIDFILFPIYLVLFSFLIRYKLKTFSDPVLKVYYKRAFFIRAFSALAYSVFLVYISSGDSYGIYYAEAVNFYKQILRDPSLITRTIFIAVKNIDSSLFAKETGGFTVFNDENNFMVVRVGTLLMFLSFGKYLILNFLFSMLALEGCWKLYKFFYEQYPELHKQFAYAILYFPTFVFWSSGISKEAICVAGIGFITYGLYAIFIKHTGILVNTLLVLLFSFLLSNVKIYILVSYLPFLIYYLIVLNVLKLKNQLLRVLVGPIIVVLSVFGFVSVIISNEDKLGVYAVEGLTETIQRQQTNFQAQENMSESNFNLGAEFDGSVTGLLKLGPAAITATLFRPFIWEAKKISTFLSSVESLLMIILTIYVLVKSGFLFFFRTIYKNPIVTYCFLFSIIFSIFVGATTLNFGSLVRYKIPCLPFYTVSMFMILHFAKIKKEKAALLATAAAA